MATRMIAARTKLPYFPHTLKNSGATVGLTAVALLFLSRVCAGAATTHPADVPEAATSTQLVTLAEGQSRILETSSPVKRVVANDPAGQILMPQSSKSGDNSRGAGAGGAGQGGGAGIVARAQLLSPRQLVITGVRVGNTQFVLMDEKDVATVYDVVVQINAAQLRALIAEAAPGSNVGVSVIRDCIILTGKISDVDTAHRVEQLARLLTPNVQNQMTVAGEQQVLLRCTVAEVNKTSLRQLGINGWLGGDNLRDAFAVSQIGGINPINVGANVGASSPTSISTNSSFLIPPSGIPISNSTNFSLGFPRVQMQIFFQALRQNSLLKILAEPNLIALNGQTATFLAGGQFPVPIPQGVGGAVTVEFKQFGIQLQFTPTVIGQQLIRLKVKPSVSELDFANGVTLGGFKIPALTERNAETMVELASGTTIALAGLLSEKARGQASKLPALGDVPVLGALFSSVQYQKDITELVILVTPELVSGMNPDQVPAVPGQFITTPNDWQLFGLGMVEGEPASDGTEPEDALESPQSPQYRKYSTSPHQMSLHGPWGPAEASETGVK